MSNHDTNTCEHGDHPAPEGKRFCSRECARCEHESTGENGCDGICGGERCVACGAPEVASGSPRTTYECGSSDYDQRDGTFTPCNTTRKA